MHERPERIAQCHIPGDDFRAVMLGHEKSHSGSRINAGKPGNPVLAAGHRIERRLANSPAAKVNPAIR